ncbi:glutamate synthase [Stylonychia lemnae]|uniref:Glutamate synthase n=1 Tax=Stylonychia lemnae TaxID=5949 RepID=A0A078AN11_STYLE|nr:glutamate synthase [Stylonychia lemnae]|eukprot:CDW82752.1 glutamate synthase [Stylonychia lemnae]
MLIRLLAQFVTQTLPGNLKNIEEHMNSNDSSLMYRPAHTVVGSSRMIGFLRLGDICDLMQKCVNAGNTNPNYDSYRYYYDVALLEKKNIEDAYEKLKNGDTSDKITFELKFPNLRKRHSSKLAIDQPNEEAKVQQQNEIKDQLSKIDSLLYQIIKIIYSWFSDKTVNSDEGNYKPQINYQKNVAPEVKVEPVKKVEEPPKVQPKGTRFGKKAAQAPIQIVNQKNIVAEEPYNNKAVLQQPAKVELKKEEPLKKEEQKKQEQVQQSQPIDNLKVPLKNTIPKNNYLKKEGSGDSKFQNARRGSLSYNQKQMSQDDYDLEDFDEEYPFDDVDYFNYENSSNHKKVLQYSDFQTQKGEKSNTDDTIQQTLGIVFKDTLQNFEPIYVASIIDSLNQLNGDYQQYYRALDLEEVLEKAELQINTLFGEMLRQRKLPEDIGFHSQDLVSIVNSFQISFAGNTDLYEKAQALAIKFKYTFQEKDTIRFVYSLLQMKMKISQELKDQVRNIQRDTQHVTTYSENKTIDTLSLPDKLKYNQIITILNIPVNHNNENEFITDRAELPADLKPLSPAKKSYKVFLKEGETYLYCTCGASNNQPFCDGSHKDLQGFKPLKFTHQDEDKIIGLCGCKLNKVEKGAYCDGSHKKIDYDSIEKERIKFI